MNKDLSLFTGSDSLPMNSFCYHQAISGDNRIDGTI